MPFVHVRLTPGVTPEQKDRVIRGMTDVLVNELGKDPAATWVVIEEVALEDWGINGVSAATAKRQRAAASIKAAAATPAKTPVKPRARAKA